MSLFVERARAQQAEIAPSDSAAGLVGAIVRDLDGLPLAIELAAARLGSMSLPELRKRLDRRFRLLTGGSRTALPRQQTLQATVDWSYELLNTTDQSVLRRLSVFAGDFDLEAAESIGVAEGGDLFEVADALRSLVDKSLVVADPSGPTVRYRLLETIRQYASDCLQSQDATEAEGIRKAHTDYYLGLVERAAPHLKGPSHGMWVARLEEEYPNLRDAIEFALATSEGSGRVLRIFGESRAYWWAVATHDADGLAALDRASDLAGDDGPPRLRAAALLCKAYMLFSSDVGAQAVCAREAAAMAGQAGDRGLRAEALGLVALNSSLRSVPTEGIGPGGEAVAIARELQDPVLLADTLAFYGAPLKEIDAAAAEAAYREALQLVERSGDMSTAILAHGDFGDLLLFLKRVDEARDELHAALSLAKIPGTRIRELALGNLGWVYLEKDDPTTAASYFTGQLRRARRSGDLDLTTFATIGLACCATQQGDLEWAATVLGGADMLNASLGNAQWAATERHFRDRSTKTLRDALGAEFERLYEKGRSMPAADLVAYEMDTANRSHRGSWP